MQKLEEERTINEDNNPLNMHNEAKGGHNTTVAQLSLHNADSRKHGQDMINDHIPPPKIHFQDDQGIIPEHGKQNNAKNINNRYEEGKISE